MNILAACSGADSPVRKVVFKSSTHLYGCEQDDPAFFDETMARPHPPRTPIERDIVEAEASLGEFAERNPEASVTILRFANVLGPDVRTSHIDLLSLPVLPMILGFDPRYQFVHEDDVVHALEHAVKHDVPGMFNVAADGVLALSEVAGLLRKPYAPLLPPWGTGLAAAALRRVGVNIPAEMLAQLRFGRGVDNRRYKAAGFHYQHTSRETVLALGEHLRLEPIVRGAREPYRYEREVEEFLRWSPHVRHARERGSGLSRDQVVELQRLLAGYAQTAGIDVDPGPEDDRLAVAEARALAAESLAAEAMERVAEAEERAREAAERAARVEETAEERSQRATERAKKAERRAAEAALKATERAKKAERRARQAADVAVERASRAERRAEAAVERPEPQPEPPPEPRPEPQPAPAPEPRPAATPLDRYDDLAAEEIIALLASLAPADLQMLLDYERSHANRAGVTKAIESVLARGGTPV
jgi:UDP-glucose 4-epimerase